jgi:hypothetical protein
MSLRIPISKARLHKYEIVDVQLRDGSIVENLAIDAFGLILGKVVGGHAGLDEAPLPFDQQDIAAYRFRAGLAARLGLAKWQTMEASEGSVP